MNSNTMSPYIIRRSNRRSVRRVARLEYPIATTMTNYDNISMLADTTEAKRLLDGDDQGGYYHDSSKATQAVPFNNNANEIRSGRQGNAYTVGYGESRARLERRR